MKNMVLALLSVVAFLYACKKEDTRIVYDNYGNLEPGNYWLYDRYYLDGNGVLEIVSNVTDSNYVEKDTLINGNTYHKLMVVELGASPVVYTPYFLRDSLHYIVDWKGTIQFSSENFSDTLATSYEILGFNMPDTISFVTASMADDGFSVTTPAGTFITKNYRQTYSMWPKYQKFGTERYLNRRYAKDVGVVDEIVGFFISSDRAIVRRLRAYGKE